MTDPRIMRTRTALRDALAKLLHDRLFEDITLNDIAEAGGLNRGTIYKHYADKFALLDGWIADDLRERLFAAMSCATSCADKVSGVVAATCECSRWATTLGRPDDRLLRPIVEARIRALVQHAVTFALAQKVVRAVGKPELVVPMAAAAVCGAALAWNGKHLPQHVAATVAALDHLIVPSAQLLKMTASISF